MAQTDQVYLPERLLARLDDVRNHRLTLIEAPSGFGKTTSFREYLRGRSEARCFWYTCLGETRTRAWNGVCDLLGNVDSAVARGLRGLGMPDRDTAAEAAALMGDCRCDHETYLVVDNYQLLECDSPTGIVNAFSLHNSDSLRMVFITQEIPGDDTWSASDILRINAGDYLFDRESVARCFKLAGLRPTPSELDAVYRASGGWVASIKLHMIHYRLTGTVAPAGDMDGLIESALWGRLPDRDRQLLMGVSLFDKFSLKQASMMIDGALADDVIADVLEKNVFIPCSPTEGVFYMHGILKDFLLRRFAETPSAFRDLARDRAGRAAAAAGDLFQATKFFLETGDYASILSLPFTTRFFYNFPERSVIDLFERLVDECPEETLLGRPMALITFAQQFFRDRRTDAFSKASGLLRRVVETPGALPEEELLRVRGEFEILTSFPHFNDIAAMSEHHRRAYADLGRISSPPRSQIFGGAMPWTMSGASVLFLYWRKSGTLDDTLSVMDECLPCYVALAGGHGAGGEYIMRAEAALARGDDAAAEVMARSALYAAHAAGQAGNSLCAWLVLARTAVLRGDRELYLSTRNSIREEAAESAQRSIMRIADLCLACTDILLGRLDDIPQWLNDAAGIRRAVYADGQPYALTLHATALLAAGRHDELRSVAEPLIAVARRMNYLLPQVVVQVLLAAAGEREGRRGEAEAHLEAALALALPDTVLMPFAEQAGALGALLNNSSIDPALLALCDRQARGVASILGTPVAAQSLSGRQAEVAAMLKDGLTVRQIAASLGISENTVKSTARAVYERLGVHTRAELRRARLH